MFCSFALINRFQCIEYIRTTQTLQLLFHFLSDASFLRRRYFDIFFYKSCKLNPFVIFGFNWQKTHTHIHVEVRSIETLILTCIFNVKHEISSTLCNPFIPCHMFRIQTHVASIFDKPFVFFCVCCSLFFSGLKRKILFQCSNFLMNVFLKCTSLNFFLC